MYEGQTNNFNALVRPAGLPTAVASRLTQLAIAKFWQWFIVYTVYTLHNRFYKN